MFEKKTKWIVLCTYNSAGNDFIVFVRKGKRTGMLFFKTKNISTLSQCSYNLNPSLFDIKESFKSILES